MTLTQLAERVEALGARLIDQSDEPWPGGSYSDRMNYWRDKAITVARDLQIAALRARGEQP